MQRGPVGHFPVKDKIVLITGGGSGIGLAFAKECHRNGAKVVIGDLSLSHEAQQFISAAGSFASTAVFKKTDVTNWQDLHDLISFSVITFKDVPDIYAPVAGIFEPSWSNFWDDEQSTYRTMEINVNHPIKLSRLAIRALVGAEKQGAVCLVASTAAIHGLYLSSLYCASKHAVLGFAKSMGRADYDEGIKFVCICPGVVDTPLWQQQEDDMMDMAKFLERKSVGPEDIAVVMRKMIESEDYEGGTCVVKTPDEERVFEKGWKGDAEKYDPSPRPESDLRRIRDALNKERGKPWKMG